MTDVTDRILGVTTSVAIKAPCIAVATTPITLAGLQSVGGVTVAEGDRVLVTDQADPIDNGIYDASSGAWSRSLDCDGARDLTQGTFVPVVNVDGTADLYNITTPNPITIGTSALTFALRYGANTKYDRTPTEIANSVIVVNDNYLPGVVLRYANNTTPGTTNMTSAFASALLATDAPYAPAGTYAVDSITLTAGKRLRTDGFSTIIQQRPGNVGTRVINITGSDAVLDSCKIIGNIATDTGEQNHAVLVGGSGASIANITIGDIYAQNIRGDALYLNAPSSYTTTNIKFGRITGNNVLRNVLTLGGASYVRGEAAMVDGACGFQVVDIEPNAVASTHVYVGVIKGACVSCVPASSALAAQNIHFGQVDLDPAFATDSTPSYSLRNVSNALSLRNTIDFRVDHLRINNHTGLGINYIWNSGEQKGEAISIGYLSSTGVGASESTYNALIQASAILSLEIQDGDVTLQATTKYVIVGDSSAAKNTRVKVGSLRCNGTVVRFCTSSRFERISINSANDVFAFRDMQDSVVSNSDITLGRLANNLTRCTLQNVNATCATSYLSGSNSGVRKYNTYFGGVSNSGTVTLANSSSTTISNPNVSADSIIYLMPTGAPAALIVANPGIYVSTRTEGTSFVVATQTGVAAGTETFAYTIH